MMWRPSTAKHRAWSSLRKAGPARQAKPPRGPSPSGAWRSLAEASESIASLVAVVLIHGPTSSGGVRHYRTMATRSAQLWWARNAADSVSPQGDSLLGPPCVRTLRRAGADRSFGNRDLTVAALALPGGRR